MRLILCLLLVLAAMFGLLCWLMVLAEPGAATGSVHPSIPAMRIGGDGLARLGGYGWLLAGLLYLAVTVIYLLVALGVASQRRTTLFWTLLGFGYLLSMSVCWLMLTSYFGYLATGSVSFWLGFPLPTALMLVAIFVSGSYLCWLYCWGFYRFIYTAEDAAEFEALLADTADQRRS